MAEKVEICYASLDLNGSVALRGELLRGYLGYLFAEDPEFHHHMERSYHYPLVQYKVIRGIPYVVGLNKYARILYERASQIDEISLPSGNFDVRAVRLNFECHRIIEKLCSYRFLTPWVAFNENNYKNYINSDREERLTLINNILVGNILSMFKGLNIRIKHRLSARVFAAELSNVMVHGNRFKALMPVFSANVTIPPLVGLGKSVSKGYGTVETYDSGDSDSWLDHQA